MKRLLHIFLLVAVCSALFITQASALEYSIDAPDDYLFGRPTSEDTIHDWESPNVDWSKNTAVMAPILGMPTGFLPGSGEYLAPNDVHGVLGVSTNQVGGAGGVSIYPMVEIGANYTSASCTEVTSELYYSNGSLGTLRIPSIGLTADIYEGTDSTTLAKGVGHFIGTSIWRGNVALAAHNRGVNAYFGQIHTLKTGDIITLATKSGRLSRTDTYGDGLSDRMVRACHTRCRTALDKAVREKLIRINPADGCKLPPQAANEIQVLTREEMQRFLIQAKEEGYSELFLVELATGLRRGEVLALQWNDLNFSTGALRIQRQVYRANGELVVSEPKTKAALRTIVLPPSLVAALNEYRQGMISRWMFPSPVKPDSPLDPATCRKRLQTILKHAGCKQVSFHALRHLFVTTALENGMDVKTLSTIVGHVSAKTTLNIYTHITDEMRQTAAAKINQGIGKCAPQDKPVSGSEDLSAQATETHQKPAFEPYKGKIRKSGTGCVTRINDHLWEGRYSPKWPDGKRHPRNIYAGTELECEEKLAALILQTKADIATAKQLLAEGRQAEAMALINQRHARGTRNKEKISA